MTRYTRSAWFLSILLTSLLPVIPLRGQSAASVKATRAGTAPVLDGRDDDAVWRTAPVTSAFRQARPTEDGDPVQRTEFRVAYDPEYLYVLVRAFDNHPDSIITQLSRRDGQTASDFAIVMIDAYHDHRTGYEFIVNPSGVKSDAAISNDGNENIAWDGIWDVATRIDSLGWIAEYRIPFSQLRFSPADEVTFGFLVWRNVERHTSAATWPLYRQSKSGFVSQFGDLTGLTGLASPKRAEVTPYLLTQNEPRATPTGFGRHGRFALGGDLRYAVASNLTLNATVNPDFGQVEADPGVLNLSAFETFNSERRPFFVTGANTFDFPVNCFVVVDCRTGEGLFYSRRIGRAPELAGRYGDASSPTASRILGAAKLTGRLASGLSVGLLNAVTERIGGVAGTTIEPTTNFAVLRANRDYAAGEGAVGLMLTAVNRSLDQWTEDYMHRSAYSGGIDARRRLGQYELSGSVMGSTVAGTGAAITETQLSSSHYFQRPGDDLSVDSTRTSLSGYSTELRFAKVGGKRVHFETGYARRSAGFEINDIGFLRRADQQSWTNWLALRFNQPNRVFQRLNWNFNWWQYWTLDGLATERAFNTNVHTQFSNRWWLHLGGTHGVGQTWCDRDCTRGGPALRVEPFFAPWGGIQGDQRNKLVPALFFNYSRADGGRSHSLDLNPELEAKLSSRFSASLSGNLSWNTNDSEWYGNVADNAGITHYTSAALDQRTLGTTARLNYTFSPTKSLQLYANPFISKGSYSRVRELADPRAPFYDDRFKAYGDAATLAGKPGFNVKQFNSNAVFRWEYRPGSTLFLVWSQGRNQFTPERGTESFGGDLRQLFRQRAENRFLVKVSYWLNR